MRRSTLVKLRTWFKINAPKLVMGALVLLGILIVLFGIYQLPAVKSRLEWRLDIAKTFVRSLINPIDELPTLQPEAASMEGSLTFTPTPLPPTSTTQPAEPIETHQVSPTPSLTPTSTLTPSLTPSPTPLPASIELPAPNYEAQDWNNCGPVALALYLRYYGWEGDQYTISDLIKPERADRNVNIDELVYYVYNEVWWLNAQIRVGGSVELLKELLAAGVPIMVEESMYLADEYWFHDDRWTGHYLLLTGYDDARQIFTSQDPFAGANRKISYQALDENWRSFNRAYILVYRPEKTEEIQNILGKDWDADLNRQNALETAQSETKSDPENAFAWFNLGSNLVYFERYAEAVEAYNQARMLTLPQRMLRYQFGPFLAYFHAGWNDELLALTEYALEVTPNSEEALLWQGWALFRAGRNAEAMDSFQLALEHHPGYDDALYAINYLQNQ